MSKNKFFGKYTKTMALVFNIFSISFVYAQYNAADDLDGDGIINSIDIDDDNDGILDTDEGICNAYSEITSIDNTNKVLQGEWADGTSYVVSFPIGDINVNGIGGVMDNTACNFNNSANFEGAQNNVDNFLVSMASTTGTTMRVTFNKPVTNIVWQNSGLDRRKIEISGTGITSTTLLKSNSQTSLVNNVLKDIDENTVHGNVCGTLATESVAGSILISGTYTVIDFLLTDNNSTTNDGFANQFILCSSNYDKDGDGIPNSYDLDSDGDGCPDISEAKVIAYLEGINQTAILMDTPITNSGGTTAAKESQINPNNGGDSVGPNNGFHDVLESGSPGVYAGAPYDLTTYYLNANAQNCVCYDAAGTVNIEKTKVGISTLNRAKVANATEWPYNLNGGYLALESKDKGFVVPRLASSNVITTPKEGMMIYDIAAKCIKIYDGITDPAKGDGTGWTCIRQRCINN